MASSSNPGQREVLSRNPLVIRSLNPPRLTAEQRAAFVAKRRGVNSGGRFVIHISSSSSSSSSDSDSSSDSESDVPIPPPSRRTLSSSSSSSSSSSTDSDTQRALRSRNPLRTPSSSSLPKRTVPAIPPQRPVQSKNPLRTPPSSSSKSDVPITPPPSRIVPTIPPLTWEREISPHIWKRSGVLHLPMEVGRRIPKSIKKITLRPNNTRKSYNCVVGVASRSKQEKWLAGEEWRAFVKEQRLKPGDTMKMQMQGNPRTISVVIARR